MAVPAYGEIARTILILRGQRVILDADLAELYGVTIKRLNEQVKRNSERFPEDFMFQLSAEEDAALRSQIATSNGAGRAVAATLPTPSPSMAPSRPPTSSIARVPSR